MTLVRKTFLVFMVAFSIQIGALAFLVGIGYRNSENQWRIVRNNQARSAAVALLTGDVANPQIQDYPGQLVVYDASQIPLASNRGGFNRPQSRIMGETVLYPIEIDGVVVGYFATGVLSFSQDQANKALLASMVWVLGVGAVVALFVSLAAAWYFSRLVARPADKMAASLALMRAGDLESAVPVVDGSEEMGRIAMSIEDLRAALVSERTIRAQWAQDLAHDLRTPVSSMKAQLEAMADGILPATAERLERTGGELVRMETLVNDLEELMRLESPEMQIYPALIDVQSFVRSSLQRFEALALAKDVELISRIGNKDLVGDEGLLFRAVSNLLANAVRHVDEHGTIVLGIEPDEDGLTSIWVSNTGGWIPADEIPHVFERLYRGEYARNTQGSGLGLTIVKRIVQLHGGTLGIQSSKDSGTRVAIRVPGIADASI